MSKKLSFEQRDLKKTSLDSAQTKKQFREPKLFFIEPKLTKHGDATKITAGFFGTFSP